MYRFVIRKNTHTHADALAAFGAAATNAFRITTTLRTESTGWPSVASPLYTTDETRWVGLYAQDTITLPYRLTLVAGFRTDWTSHALGHWRLHLVEEVAR